MTKRCQIVNQIIFLIESFLAIFSLSFSKIKLFTLLFLIRLLAYLTKNEMLVLYKACLAKKETPVLYGTFNSVSWLLIVSFIDLLEINLNEGCSKNIMRSKTVQNFFRLT